MTNFMKKIMAAVTGAMLLVSPVAAMAECKAPIAQVQEAAKSVPNASVVKLSQADKLKVMESLGAPPVDEPFEMYIIFTEEFARILITKDTAPDGSACVEGFSGELNVRAIRNLLGLEEASA